MDTTAANFWWEIIITGKEEETIKVTMAQAEAVTRAIKNRDPHVIVNGEPILVRNIKRVRQSDRAISIDEERYMLESGKLDPSKKGPLVHPETGDVMWRWAKKWVSKKRYDSWYAKSPGYYLIEARPSAVLIGYKLMMETNQRLASDVMLCSKTEILELDRKAGTSPRPKPN